MRQVTFLEVGMENYGLYIDPMVLPFNNNTLTLIVGPNGIGKTMALEALTFTLYGMTSKGQRGDDVVNNVVGKNCHTWSKFKLNDDNYKVDRYHKHTKLGNTVILNKNGVDIKKGSKEVIPEIERLIAPRKLFTNTLMFGQKVKDFFTDLIDSDKKEIFRMILALDIYQILYKITDGKIKAVETLMEELGTKIKVNTELVVDCRNQLAILEKRKQEFLIDQSKQIQEIKTKIEDNERVKTTWEESLKTLRESNSDVDEAKSKLQTLNNSLESLSKNRENISKDLENQKSLKIAEVEKQASITTSGIIDIFHSAKEEADAVHTNETQEILDHIMKIEKEKSKTNSAASGLISSILMVDKQKKELEESLNLEDPICPTCFQFMDEECKENLQDQIGDLGTEIGQYEKRSKDHDIDLEKFEAITASLNEKLTNVVNRDHRIEIEDLTKIKDNNIKNVDDRLIVAMQRVQLLVIDKEAEIENQTKSDFEEIQKEVDNLNQVLEETERNARLINQAEETIKNLENQQKYNDKLLKDAEEMEFDKSQTDTQINRKITLENEIKEHDTQLQILSRKLIILEFWKKAYSPTGIPAILIDEAVPFMNERIAEYLEKLTNGRYIVSFDTLASTKSGEFRDKISVNVVDTLTRANSRIQLSGGQTRIIDIATILTLRDLQSNIQDVNFNILIFDEIFDSLDEENIGFVSKVLTQLKIGKSIYLISHRHEDQLETDETLELRR